MELRQRLHQWLGVPNMEPTATQQTAAVMVFEPATHSISVEQKPEDAPKFSRVYKARLDDRASITVTMRSWSYGRDRMADGELTQPNGRWVLFDPRAVADKILDPLLLPLIQRHVDEIFRLDAEFMQSAPSRFTDERGQAWGKLPAMQDVRRIGAA